MEYSLSDQKSALDNLKQIRKGDTLYTILRHVSSSGMLRTIDVIETTRKNRLYNLGWSVAVILNLPYDNKYNGTKVSGTGMDMGFHLIYSLSSVLFNDGYAINQKWL